jgi:hypothetical protein
MTLRPRTTLRHGKGQQEGFAVTGITQKPGAEEEDFDPSKQPVKITVV